MKIWMESYRNHILHCSIYMAVAAYSLNLLFSSSLSSSILPDEPPPSYWTWLTTTTTTLTSLISSSWNGWNLLFMFVAGLAILNLYSEFRYMIQRRSLPPGDSGLPIFGHIIQLLALGPREFKLRHIRKYCGGGGTSGSSLSSKSSSKSPTSPTSMVTFNARMRPTVVMIAEDDVSWALVQERKGNLVPRHMPHVMKMLGPETIMFQHSTTHKRLRKIFQPSFNPSVIQGYIKIMDETIQSHLEKWSVKSKDGNNNRSDNDSFLPSSEWSILAMRLFFVCAFNGSKMATCDNKLLETLSSVFHTWSRGAVTFVPFTGYIPGTKLYQAYQARKQLLEIMSQLVQEFKVENPPGSSHAQNSMMGRLCYGVDDETGEPLSEIQLIVNILFILFAGHDTTKGSFCAFAHYLTEYPTIRDMVRKEVMQFKEPLDVDELKNAPILNSFMAETWRFVPPISAHNLRTTTDLQYKGYKLRKNTSIMLDIQTFNIMDSHHRFKDPLEFRLDRWLPPDHPMHNPTYYQKDIDYNVPSVKYRAFGMGQHMCLGSHFARIEARIVLTRLLQKYDVEIQNNQLNTVPLLQYTNDFKLHEIS